jgi:MYXO-CTERM domain-containing protein
VPRPSTSTGGVARVRAMKKIILLVALLGLLGLAARQLTAA